jgi:choline kinase
VEMMYQKLDDIGSNEIANFEVVVLKSVSGCLEYVVSSESKDDIFLENEFTKKNTIPF